MLLSSSEEDTYIRVFPYHSLPVLNVSSLTNSRQAFYRRARWLILGAHSDQEKLADSNKGPVGSREKLFIIEVLQPTNSSKDISSLVCPGKQYFDPWANWPKYKWFTQNMELIWKVYRYYLASKTKE